jgi:pimeloyl-ACP methyl ester carboxylesterase
MSTDQADHFANNWAVAAQYTDPATGVSATVFQDSAGKNHLAIRGTELAGSDLTADGLLALGIPSSLNPQFTALKTQLDAWLANGTLGTGFTVAGHSLGGYLATAVKQTYTQVTDAYLFNAPGVGGPLGNLADALTSTLGLSGTPSGNIWNIRGSEGFPAISGLGYQLGTAISIQTEAASGAGLANHSVVRLTDALAVQSLYAQLVPGLTQDKLNALVDASGATMNLTFESALDALRVILFGPGTTQTVIDDRNAFYTNLYNLTSDARYTALAGTAQLTVLVGFSANDNCWRIAA